ncbi:zinc finger TRAF-type-containing protein 1-B [Parasteatoda tepidariorum]|uniref:zinc finger TRAF-type-containing protein 1-B n=1 Tax=Parasteatoda tepidariorum TaxID=114398 RepID=UPI001C71CD83|nr:cysteine and histidine-rich protein 1-B [Parasteatoda tepidariorum]
MSENSISCDGNLNTDEDCEESKSKKQKVSDEPELEDRLQEILCCAVCLDLPKSAVYQCRNGHLVCSECFNHLLADAQLRLGAAVCPCCRTLISKDMCVRNLVVEKAVSEMPMNCAECSAKFPRCMREVHEKELCLERHSLCCYYRIGCPWSGPYKKKADHEKRCAQPQKTGAEIKEAIPDVFLPVKSGGRNHLCDYLSFEKIACNDLQLLGPYHTDEYCIRFETFRFCAFGMEWEIRAHVNDNEADPTLSCERTLSYQLLLKESVDRPIHMHYTVVKGPLGEMKLRPHIEEFKFSDETPESHYALLPLEDSIECYRLLSGTIRFRLIMFWDDSSLTN